MRNKFFTIALLLTAAVVSCQKNNAKPDVTPANPAAATPIITGTWAAGHISFIVLKKGSSEVLPGRVGSTTTGSWDFNPDGHLYIGSSAVSFSYRIAASNKLVLTRGNISDSLDIKVNSARRINFSSTRTLANGDTYIENVDLEKE